jgi:hypothetical protein
MVNCRVSIDIVYFKITKAIYAKGELQTLILVNLTHIFP